MRTALMCITMVGGILIYLPTRHLRTLAFHENESWQFIDGNQTYEGLTTSGSYRSLMLIVVAIKPSQGRTQHAVVWRDSVQPEVFSALHIRLALTSAHQLQ